ncbi:MAG: IS30 family transposase, partial [Ruminococcus sp.]|nr:IS30 family transposase [Ruminococcus sp.]
MEILLKAGHKAEEIGQLLGGRSKRTIQREIALGKVQLL